MPKGKQPEITIEDALKGESIARKRDTKADKQKFAENFGADKLKVRIKSVEEKAKLNEKLAEAMSSNFEAKDDTLPSYFNELKSRTKVEKEISKLPNLSRTVENLENAKDLRNLDIKNLLMLESKYEGILMYAFTDVINGDRQEEKIDFKNWNNYKNAKAGTKVRINFYGNMEAETQLGIGDIFPPSIRKVTVYKQGKPENARTSERRLGLKGRNQDNEGFFDKKGYIPVYSGDVVVSRMDR